MIDYYTNVLGGAVIREDDGVLRYILVFPAQSGQAIGMIMLGKVGRVTSNSLSAPKNWIIV